MQIPGECGGTIALVDIDKARLSLNRMIARLMEQLGKSNWKVVANVDRTKVLRGTDYVVNCIEVSGEECVVHDNDIPLKYGVDQCIGDTIGPGGLFKALRTIPVWLDVLRDCERLCPDALVLNYTNPMSMMCLAAGRESSMEVVGLCHSVQGTSTLLAKYAEVPYDELDWECAGINHLSWFTKLQHNGKDLYKTKLHRKLPEKSQPGSRNSIKAASSRMPPTSPTTPLPTARLPSGSRAMCVHFGAFITESSGHLSEYLPYYRKSEAGRKPLRLAYDGGSVFMRPIGPAGVALPTKIAGRC